MHGAEVSGSDQCTYIFVNWEFAIETPKQLDAKVMEFALHHQSRHMLLNVVSVGSEIGEL